MVKIIGAIHNLPHIEGREYYVDGTPATYPAFKPFWEMVNDIHPGRVLSTSYHCTTWMDRIGDWHTDAGHLNLPLDIFLLSTKTGTEFKTEDGIYTCPTDTVMQYTHLDVHRSPAPVGDLRLLLRIIKRSI